MKGTQHVHCSLAECHKAESTLSVRDRRCELVQARLPKLVADRKGRMWCSVTDKEVSGSPSCCAMPAVTVAPAYGTRRTRQNVGRGAAAGELRRRWG